MSWGLRRQAGGSLTTPHTTRTVIATVSTGNMRIVQRLGSLCVALAVTTCGGWTLWVNSRIWCPIRVPLSLAENSSTTTRDFKVNVSGHYDIGVEATASNTIPLKELTCQ